MKTNKKKKKVSIVNLILYLVILGGLATVLYPFVNNWLYERQTQKSEVGYDKKVEELSDEDEKKMLEEARLYNESLTKQSYVLSDPFSESQQAMAEIGYVYDDIMNLGGGVMGYIEIPSQDINLPIFHGCEDDVLERGAGHMGSSSIPIGGESTHAIITGHTGISKAKMFDNLSKMKKGDLFFIKVLDQTLAYKVSEIEIIKPDDLSHYAIQEGKDLVTLVTCHPYGVNTHRLLVTGERTPYTEDMKNYEMKKAGKDSWLRQWLGLILLYGIPALMILFLVYVYFKKKKKKELGNTQGSPITTDDKKGGE